MAMTTEKRKKLRSLLDRISTADEKKRFDSIEQATGFFEDMDKTHQAEIKAEVKRVTDNFEAKFLALLGAIDQHNTAMRSYHKNVQESHTKTLNTILGAMKGHSEATIKVMKEAGEPTVPMFGRMIEAISGVGEEVKKKPVPVWRWPQYVATSVRNKSFSQINPATADNQVFNTVVSGNKASTTPGTAVQLVTAATPCSKVTVFVPTGNTSTQVAVGDSSVKAAGGSEKGHILISGSTYDFYVTDASLLYFDVGTSGDKISYNIYKTV